MLTFVTCLRHPHNATDYPRVEQLLLRTLGSIARQIGDPCRVVVVGNREPSVRLSPSVRFVTVDHPPASAQPGTRIPRDRVLLDKGVKLALGAALAAERAPTHLMLLDADDMISRRLAGHVAGSPGAPGWYVEHGYVYSPARGLLEAVDRFHDRCGSSFIFRTDLLDLPPLSPSASREDVLAAVGETKVIQLFGSHMYAREQFQGDRALQPLPFPAALYVVDTGENHSGRILRSAARPVSTEVAEDFGIAQTRTSARSWGHAGGQIAMTAARDASRLLRRTRRSP